MPAQPSDVPEGGTFRKVLLTHLEGGRQRDRRKTVARHLGPAVEAAIAPHGHICKQF